MTVLGYRMLFLEINVCKAKLPSRFFTKQKTKSNDLPSLHGIKLHFRELTRTKNRLIPCFFVQKAVVLDVKNSGFSRNKRRN